MQKIFDFVEDYMSKRAVEPDEMLGFKGLTPAPLRQYGCSPLQNICGKWNVSTEFSLLSVMMMS